MKLISINQSQVVWLFKVTRLHGPAPIADLVGKLVTRYEFAGYPVTAHDFSQNEASFTYGKFQNTSIEKLQIYHDGVIADTRGPVEVADEFLNDAVAWLQAECGYEMTEYPKPRKLFNSSLEVQLNIDFETALRPLNKLASELTTLLRGYELVLPGPYKPVGFSVDCDASMTKIGSPGAFRVERRDTEEHKSNCYFATAPLMTRDHLQLLEKLEGIFAYA